MNTKIPIPFIFLLVLSVSFLTLQGIFLLTALESDKWQNKAIYDLQMKIEILRYPAPKTFLLPDEVIDGPGKDN